MLAVYVEDAQMNLIDGKGYRISWIWNQISTDDNINAIIWIDICLEVLDVLKT